MRHRVAHRKLGRVTEHRISLLRNQAVALIRHERITTTVPKANELRPFIEPIIAIASRCLDAAEGSTAGGNPRRAVRRCVQRPGQTTPWSSSVTGDRPRYTNFCTRFPS